MNNSRESSKDRLRKRKFLRNKRSFIFISILCMGIGFAFLSTNLTITGNTSVSGNSWNIYFTNVQIAKDSVEATVVPTTSGTNTTSIDYIVTLDKPGDFYEFTVDAVNNGTINAMIQNVNMTSLDSDVAKYISYTATYEDGTPLAENDVLKKNTTATYKVRVEYKKNISAGDLSDEDNSLTLTFGVNYVQAPKPVLSDFTKMVKNNSLSDSGIDFTKISSNTNGKGLYLMESTKNDDYPIYYYRGNVSNNNAKFAGFCWKIVRTTETGGTKLIYNGTPNASGQCTNTTGTATQLTSTSGFNTNYNSPSYVGYMYGTTYTTREKSYAKNYLYASSFTYKDGIYTLSDDTTTNLRWNTKTVLNNHHYTCFSSSNTCSELYYVYYYFSDSDNQSTRADYITLTGGKDIGDVLDEMLFKSDNTTDSAIKLVLDNWFEHNIISWFSNQDKTYNNYIEDAIWCNDRNIGYLNAFNPNGGSIDGDLRFASYKRIYEGVPSVICSNKNDAFTVSDSKIGNALLDYPVGLLTADEVSLAGATISTTNTSYYLYTGQSWYTMTPYFFGNSSASFSRFNNFLVNGSGYFSSSASSAYGVRPSISLKPTVKIATGGDGTSDHPYEFLVD